MPGQDLPTREGPRPLLPLFQARFTLLMSLFFFPRPQAGGGHLQKGVWKVSHHQAIHLATENEEKQ